jgi:Tol biopolymer transport system component
MAYLWDTGEKPFHVQLRIASNDSGKSRVVLDNPENNYYQPLDWSPDGKRLLVSIQKLDKTWQLEWVSAVDGAVVLLKSVGWRFYNTGNRPRLSPNGQFIAYSALAENPGTSCSAMARLFY